MEYPMGKVVKLGLHPEKFERPLQFDIFESRDTRVTNTIAIWDVAPRCVFRKQAELRDGQYLKTIEREFVYGSQLYRLTLYPARFKRGGKAVEEYPGEMEQLVEEVIRKLAVKGNRLDYNSKNEVGITFKVFDVRKELERTNHKVSHNDVVEALHVLHKSVVEIQRVDTTPEGETIVKVASGSAFPQLRLAEKGAEDTSITVQFNWMVSEALMRLDFRQIDYETVMSMKGPIERWLYKKITHDILYHGGDLLIHEVKASEIVEGCGITIRSRQRDTLRRIPDAVEALKAHGVIDEYVATDIKDGRKKVDIDYKLITSKSFMAQITAAMHRSVEDRHAFQEITGEEPSADKVIPSDRVKRIRLERIRAEGAKVAETLSLPLPDPT
jgi:hypothetical protein